MQKTSVACIGTDWGINEERKKNDWYGGVTYYRLIKPLVENKNDKYDFIYYGSKLHLEAEGKTPAEFWDEFTDRHDVFIIKHIDNPEPASNLLFFCKKKGKTIIIDLDDNLFEVKPDQPAWELYKPGSEKRSFVSALLSLVHGIFVSTQPLKDYYTNYLKNVHKIDHIPIYVLPNYADKKDWDFEPKKNDTGKIRIGWAGSTTHFNDLKEAIPAVARILKEFPNVEFYLLGGVSHETAGELFGDVDDDILNRISVGSGTQSWQGYPELMSKQMIDIGIAPLTNDEFNRGKSHIKWMEYAMYKIPCVASRVYPYQMDILGIDTIQNGKTGFLCDKKEWYKTLKKLVENDKLRTEIGENAYNYVTKNFDYSSNRNKWVNALDDLLSDIEL